MRRLAPIAFATVLAACSRDPSFCTNPGAPISLAGRCYSESAAAGNVIAWAVGVLLGLALIAWWIMLFVGIRRDVRRIADALDRRDR